MTDRGDDNRRSRESRGRIAEDGDGPVHLDLEVLGRAAPDVCILFIGPKPARDLARRVHDLGRGRPGRFKVIDCRRPDDLLEQQVRHGLRPGSSGTLFLEEVGRLSREMQTRLLQALDVVPDPRGPRPPRARIMAWTSEPLLQRALEGTFDERLFYRLNAIQIVVPVDLGDL